MGDEDLLPIVRGLAAIAGAEAEAGLDAWTPFAVRTRDVEIEVRYSGGSSPHVYLTTPYAPRARPPEDGVYRGVAQSLRGERPMVIQLSHEVADERDAKARGVFIEVQTGDAEFDRAVYVDAVAAPDLVKAVLASPALRRAAMVLLADGFGRIEIDDEHGQITIQRGTSYDGKQTAAVIADGFATIASEVPVVEGKRRTFAKWPNVVAAAGIVGVPIAVVLAFKLVAIWKVFAWVLAGAAVGGGIGYLTRRTQYGRSDSHHRVRLLVATTTIFGTMFGAGTAIAIETSPWALLGVVATIAVTAIVLVFAVDE